MVSARIFSDNEILKLFATRLYRSSKRKGHLRDLKGQGIDTSDKCVERSGETKFEGSKALPQHLDASETRRRVDRV